MTVAVELNSYKINLVALCGGFRYALYRFFDARELFSVDGLLGHAETVTRARLHFDIVHCAVFGCHNINFAVTTMLISCAYNITTPAQKIGRHILAAPTNRAPMRLLMRSPTRLRVFHNLLVHPVYDKNVKKLLKKDNVCHANNPDCHEFVMIRS